MDKKVGEHHWEGERPDPDNYYGFVYNIINTLNNKQYIGRKFYHMWNRGKKKGDSNWRTYTGSSKKLNKDIQKHGKEHFRFIILCQWKTRGGVINAECNLQHFLNVLTAKDKYGEKLYYNESIGGVRFVAKEELTEEHRERISKAKMGHEGAWKGKKRPDHSKTISGQNNGLYDGDYLLYKEDGTRLRVPSLYSVDGYQQAALHRVMSGKQKYHKDIIKVVKEEY